MEVSVAMKKEIKIALIEQDLTVEKLARKTRYSKLHLYHVISGRSESLRVKKVIALALGKEFRELWPNPNE